MKRQKLIPLLVIATGLLAYHNGLRSPFIFDDRLSIVENPHIRHLWPIGEALSAPPGCPVDGRPVVCLTLAVNYAWGGLNVIGYHVFNLMLHLASALVLFGIVRRTLEGGKLRDRFGAAAIWLAATIAVIWEVHPLQTESVTYIVQRSELLMGLFLLLTVYCTLRSSRSSHPGAWCFAAVLACALGMGSKEVMVGAPLIVLLYDRAFLASSFREQWRQRWGLYVALPGTWLMLARLVAGTHNPVVGFGHGLSPWRYLETQAGVIPYYLRLCFWPQLLVIDYYDWPIANSLGDVWSGAVVMAALLGGAIWVSKRHPGPAFLGAWFFLILAPTSSFLPIVGEVVAERRMYLPLAAVVTMVVVGAFTLGKGLFTGRQGVLVGSIVGGCVVVALLSLTIQRNRDYSSELSIWQDTVKKRPHNSRAHDNLAGALTHAGRVPEAIMHLEQALRIDPGRTSTRVNLGNALLFEGKVSEAIGQYEQVLRIRPDFADAHNNLGFALERAGRVQESIGQYEQALQLKPDYVEAYYNLGVALERLGRVEESIGEYEQALRLKPDFAEAHNSLGVALVKLGKIDDAIGHYEQALRIKPDYAEAHYNLGVAFVRLGKVQEAISHWEEALRIKPDFTQAKSNLARARAVH
jgi:tetratricopeptide (TPR) repeat protein